MHWAPAPVEHGKGHGGGHNRNAAKAFVLIEGERASLALINPKLNETALSAEHNRVTIKATGMDNYHALVALRSQDHLHESAIRYHYMHGKPSGESPSQLMAYEKSVLEIEPAPYAREHWRYLSNTDAKFLLRFKGEPLAAADVRLTTANGTTSQFRSDAQGMVVIPLPEDFPTVRAGRMGNRASEFILSAEHLDGTQAFTTTLSADYHVNPEHWQSTELGLAVVGGGMLFGGLITWRTRRRKEKK